MLCGAAVCQAGTTDIVPAMRRCIIVRGCDPVLSLLELDWPLQTPRPRPDPGSRPEALHNLSEALHNWPGKEDH